LAGNPGPATAFMRQLPTKWNDLPPRLVGIAIS
jgi:hypothetical protein